MMWTLEFLLACSKDDFIDSMAEECMDLEATGSGSTHFSDHASDGPTGAIISYEPDAVVIEMFGAVGGFELGMYAPEWSAEACWPRNEPGTFCHRACTDELGTARIPCVDRKEDVTDETTLICALVEAAGGTDESLTYYMGEIDRSWCAVNGPDVAHYADAGCEPW